MTFSRAIFTAISHRQKFLAALFLLLPLFPCEIEAACVCGGDGMFTTVTPGQITIDGTMNDWGPVLADPDNNSCDDQGTALPSSDRDFGSKGIQSTGRDLIQFVFTWDSNSVYTYTERAGSANNTINFIYYADIDNDGLMETGEPAIIAAWQGSNRTVDVSIGNYSAANAGGDSMVDANGYGDGYTLPGQIVNIQSQSQLSGNWGSSDGMNMEWSVPWSSLGIAAGTAFTFHVSSTNATPGAGSYPSQIDDNMGGCGGKAATTQYAALIFTPDRTIPGSAGTTVYADHFLTNTGNGADRFNLSSSPYTVSYYRDADGSGTFTAGDILLTDTDGDGQPDTGSLPAGAGLQLLIAYALPASGTGTAVTSSATSKFDPNHSAAITDTLQVISPSLTVVKSASGPTARPGEVITYTVQVFNSGTSAATNVVLDDHMGSYTVWQLDFNGGGPPYSPFSFTPGTSGLTLGTPDYSRDGGTTWGQSPVTGGGGAPAGYDDTVTNWKIPMTGSMAAGGSFTLQYKVKVK